MPIEVVKVYCSSFLLLLTIIIEQLYSFDILSGNADGEVNIDERKLKGGRHGSGHQIKFKRRNIVCVCVRVVTDANMAAR